MNPIDKAFPAHMEFDSYTSIHDWLQYAKFTSADIDSEFTQLKSLCAEMGEALENITNDTYGSVYSREIAEKALAKFQSVFNGELDEKS